MVERASIGSYYGREALLWTHKYLGEIIFIVWTAMFWALLFRYMPSKEDMEGEKGGEYEREDDIELGIEPRKMIEDIRG